MNYQETDPSPQVIPAAVAKPERPFALKAVCALLMFQGLALLSVVVLFILSLFNPEVAETVDVTVIQVFKGVGAVAELILLGVAGAMLVWVALGLWRLNPWAWRWTMIVLGAFLIINLYSYFDNSESVSSTASLMVDVLIVFYMVQPEVRRLYIDKPKIDSPAESR